MSLTGTCADCRHFRNAPSQLEALLPGLRALGSAHGAVRGSDGVCELHQRYLRAGSRCAAHAALPTAPRA